MFDQFPSADTNFHSDHIKCTVEIIESFINGNKIDLKFDIILNLEYVKHLDAKQTILSVHFRYGNLKDAK
jgi:hypothetical protein